MLSNIVKSAGRHAIRATTKRSSPFAVFTPRHQHSATPLPIQSVDTEKIMVLPSPNSIHADLAQTDTQTLSHADPGPESQSANFIDQFSPYLLTTYSRPPVVFNRGQGSHLWDLRSKIGNISPIPIQLSPCPRADR